MFSRYRLHIAVHLNNASERKEILVEKLENVRVFIQRRLNDFYVSQYLSSHLISYQTIFFLTPQIKFSIEFSNLFKLFLIFVYLKKKSVDFKFLLVSISTISRTVASSIVISFACIVTPSSVNTVTMYMVSTLQLALPILRTYRRKRPRRERTKRAQKN